MFLLHLPPVEHGHLPWPCGDTGDTHMLKFLGAYAISKLLGFGLLGALVIYLLIR